MNYSPNSLKRGYIGECAGGIDYGIISLKGFYRGIYIYIYRSSTGVIEWDTWSLDYSSSGIHVQGLALKAGCRCQG